MSQFAEVGPLKAFFSELVKGFHEATSRTDEKKVRRVNEDWATTYGAIYLNGA
jgi:hypothetical protein